MHKRLPSTEDNMRPMLTLRNSIVPMLNPPPFSEDGIRIICDVSRRVNTGAVGFQMFVHDDAVIDCNDSLLEGSRHRDCAHSNNHKVTREFLVVTKKHSLNSIFSFQCGDTCLFYNPYST